MSHDRYVSPFSTRYASGEMQFVFSEDNKFRTWRRLWIALAKAEQAQGLDITDEQIAELEAHADDINYEDARRREREVRHETVHLWQQAALLLVGFYLLYLLFWLAGLLRYRNAERAYREIPFERSAYLLEAQSGARPSVQAFHWLKCIKNNKI